ncbi:MAG: D-alanine--D-alanine ligase family protein [Limnochordia bacterium]|jgi:D-alanine-D-alanine ligase
MKAIVTYNVPSSAIPEDYICHEGVLDQVRDVTRALEILGHSYEVLGVGHDIKRELSYLADCDADVVLNLCESINGQSGLQPCFAGYLELLGIPFTGSDSAGITVAIDKRQTKAILQSRGVNTPPGMLASALIPLLDPSREKALSAKVCLPVIVKPAREDGSIGITQQSVATTWDELRSAVNKAAERFGADNVLVERFIEGREFYVGFLGNTQPQALPVSEITFENLPSELKPIMSYDAKWDPDSQERHSFRRLCPAPLAPETRTRLVELCEAAYKTVGLSGYGRIDVRWNTDTDEMFVLDVNANPDITDGQGFPVTAAEAGLSYPELIEAIIKYALEHNRNRS